MFPATQRNGLHKTIFSVKRDPKLNDKNILRNKGSKVYPFVTAEVYAGSWEGNRKNGFGMCLSDTARYEGEYMHNLRHGLGTLWIKQEEDGKWRRVYSGGWAEGKREGNGAYFYRNGDIYRGEWVGGDKCGTGIFAYANGDRYEGSFKYDGRCGRGRTVFSNGDLHEGHYANDCKEGPGLYFYASSLKVYAGEWSSDLPRCGEMRNVTAAETTKLFIGTDAATATCIFDMPELELLNPSLVLSHAVADVRLERTSHHSLDASSSTSLSSSAEELHRAEAMFSDLDVNSAGVVSAADLSPVLLQLGLNIDDSELVAALSNIGLHESTQVTFTEALDIANIINRDRA